ncbi:hypothetical protein M4D51_06155 [Microbacterium sp. p3-SID338]|uniref:hypothetical protein n=1 Tax=unclassified Microbacterium TaxID=2609290 RepID=UPI0015E09CC6|nr:MULTISPECIES: hypothetical protein [unclassified Microbacterium]MCT1395305.1 hypothetical protein [Microbacterium sp. p3-SID338]
MNGSPTPRPRTLLSGVAAIVFAISVLIATPAGAATPQNADAPAATSLTATAAAGPVKSLVTDGFRAGNIISNDVFYDTTTMSAASIDSFFRSKVSSCQSGYVCLKDYRQNTPNRAADAYCNGYQGAANESAATIIAKVAQSCGINPQVFIVMLQKEQGLVTHTWPSSWRYTMALGQGCPDTAPCDPAFAGFFYQIYGAGRQMKIYTEGRYFTYYAPGRTWNILYNPNAACGRGPVYVENEATSALYYYTPYQPNAAALRAGYGEGDGCSAYGNRNFHNYFTDWFGSTQISKRPTVGTIMVPGGDKIYMLMGGVKYHVRSAEDLAPFSARYGGVTVVSPAYLNGLPEGRPITRYVHDPRTGTLYLLEADGTKHRFVDPGQVARFGYDFSSYVNLTGAVADAFSTGAEVGNYIRSGSAPEVYLMEGGTKRYIATVDAWNSVTGGAPAYVASMTPAVANAVPNGRIIAPAGTLVRTAAENRVYLTLPQDRLAYVPSFGLASEFGASTFTTVPNGALDAHQRVPGGLSPVIQCGQTRYLAAAGSLHRITGSDLGGMVPFVVAEAECSAFRIASDTVSAPFFVQPRGTGEVYVIASGALRYVRTPADLTALNGSRPLALLSWAPETTSWFGVGAEYVPEGAFVNFQGRPEVYRYTQGALHHVRSAATLTALGGGKTPPLRTLPGGRFSSFTVGAPLLTENEDFVQFQGRPEVYRYANASLHHVQSMATLVRLGGGAVPPILSLDAAFASSYVIGSPLP